MPQRSNVCPDLPLSRDRFKTLLAAAWSRTAAACGSPMVMAAAMGLSDKKTITRATGMQNTPEAHAVFNSLLADPAALDEVLAAYGFRLAPIEPAAANDFATLSGVCGVASDWAAAMQDGRRDHNETLRLADKVRPLLPALTAVVREADALRGAA